MNWTKENLIVAILKSLNKTSPLMGVWPLQVCKFCSGESSGYPDSQSFEHDKGCTHILVEKLIELDSQDC